MYTIMVLYERNRRIPICHISSNHRLNRESSSARSAEEIEAIHQTKLLVVEEKLHW
jgi:hypothetical protein